MKGLSRLEFNKCPDCQCITPIVHKKRKGYAVVCFACEHEGKVGKTIEEAKEKWNQEK